jgi:hypothetical protein
MVEFGDIVARVRLGISVDRIWVENGKYLGHECFPPFGIVRKRLELLAASVVGWLRGASGAVRRSGLAGARLCLR